MTTASADTLEFQAETTQLLDLMVHSLYTNREIFLRELISNASDALDDLRFQSVVDPAILEGDDRFSIRLEVDKSARTLSISDTGVGMSRQAVIDNIGTIAKSGTRELKNRLRSAATPVPAGEPIGQFGVGFYSTFMVASRIRLVTRRAGQPGATEWESDGKGTYTVRDVEKAERGTTITLYLLPADPDQGLEDYADAWRIASLVRRYSDFISYPIVMAEERDEGGTTTVEDKCLNSMKPIWMRPRSEVRDEEYSEFYRHLSHDWSEPLKVVRFSAEGLHRFEALLYIPAQAPYDLYYAAPDVGLRLFASRVLVIDKTEELLPRYLRFVKGVVDATDLPLNISRQRLQQDGHTALIRKHLTRKIVGTLQEMFEHDKDTYLKFWEQFGAAMKEGAASDFENKERLIPLLLFQSSAGTALTTLDEYVARMPGDQREIFYLTGESRQIVESSPHLEAVREKAYEVLYLVDPVDELLLQHLPEFAGKKLKSVGKGALTLGDEDRLTTRQDEYRGLLETLQQALETHVKQVRLTTRLRESPACLVVEEHDYSPVLERLLQKGKGGGPKHRRVLELNPDHPFVERLRARQQSRPNDPIIGRTAEFLFGLALLAEGSELADAPRFTTIALSMADQVV